MMKKKNPHGLIEFDRNIMQDAIRMSEMKFGKPLRDFNEGNFNFLWRLYYKAADPRISLKIYPDSQRNPAELGSTDLKALFFLHKANGGNLTKNEIGSLYAFEFGGSKADGAKSANYFYDRIAHQGLVSLSDVVEITPLGKKYYSGLRDRISKYVARNPGAKRFPPAVKTKRDQRLWLEAEASYDHQMHKRAGRGKRKISDKWAYIMATFQAMKRER